MTLTIHCPGCQSPLQVREEYAGKTLKCPRCDGVITVPDAAPAAEAPDPAPADVVAAGAEHIEEVRPVPRPVARRPAPETAVEEGAPPVRPRRRHGEEEGARTDRHGRPYKPCPRCSTEGATRVTWTPWGSFYGPALLNHVRCPKCGYAYNGRSGRSNTVAAIFFVAVPLLLIVAIVVGMLFALGILGRR